MDWIGQHWLDWASLLLIAAGVWWLMPQAVARPKIVGLLVSLAGLGLLATRVDDFSSPIGETVLFWLFAVAAVLSAILMITNRNPVYSALWFALVTLSVCGLFLLQFAPFLAAATVVVYAGAIVVTFVFVIMLAQQSGATVYDQRSRQPFVATVAAFMLLATIIGTLQFTSEHSTADNGATAITESASETPDTQDLVMSAVETPATDDVGANPFSQLAADQSMGRMRALGRSLFGDYLFAVELAGTLLLVATIGAIAIAPAPATGDAMTGDIERYLVVGALLFVLGVLGFFTRRNLIVLMLSAEMMLHGVSLTLVAFSRLHHNLEGQAFTIFILTVATSEAGLALAVILALYQKSNSLDIELWTDLREADLPPPMAADDARQSPFVPPTPQSFPQLTPAGAVPDVRGVRDPSLLDDTASPTANSPLEPPNAEDVVKTAVR